MTTTERPAGIVEDGPADAADAADDPGDPGTAADGSTGDDPDGDDDPSPDDDAPTSEDDAPSSEDAPTPEDARVGDDEPDAGPSAPVTAAAPVRLDRRVARRVRLAVVAAALAAAFLGAAFASTSQLYSSGDEAAHVDYAYQVWTGELPVFEDGLVIDPGFGFRPPVQWVAQHPPLYYVLLAPVVGPAIDADEHLLAGFAARGVNALLAALVVVAAAWSAAQAVPRRPALWTAVALVVGLNAWLVRVAGSVYNDLLCVLWATLLLGLTSRTLRRGPTWRVDTALAVVGAAALATRASLAVVVGLCGLVMFVHRAATRAGWWATLRLLLVGAVAVAPTVPFYLRNLELTGRLVGGDPAWAAENLGSRSRPVLQVATDFVTWRDLGSLFALNGIDGRVTTGSLLLLPVAVAVVVALVRRVVTLVRRRRHGRAPRPAGGPAVAVLLGGVVLAVLTMQLFYSADGGGTNPRYLLPVLLPVALVVAYALTSPGLRHVLLPAWCALAVADVVVWVARMHARGLEPGTAPTSPLVAGAALMACTVAVVAAVHQHALLARHAPPAGPVPVPAPVPEERA